MGHLAPHPTTVKKWYNPSFRQTLKCTMSLNPPIWHEMNTTEWCLRADVRKYWRKGLCVQKLLGWNRLNTLTVFYDIFVLDNIADGERCMVCCAQYIKILKSFKTVYAVKPRRRSLIETLNGADSCMEQRDGFPLSCTLSLILGLILTAHLWDVWPAPLLWIIFWLHVLTSCSEIPLLKVFENVLWDFR